jgi:hypothetical protein
VAHDVFVSYSNKDRTVANAVVARLEKDSIRCWVAPRDIVPGTSWGEAIAEAIGASRVMILILSGHSNRSRQVIREVERAVAGDVVILPFRIENVDPTGAMAYFLGSEHWLDAITPPLEQHIERLSLTVATLLDGRPLPHHGPGPAPGTTPGGRRPAWLPLAIGALVATVAAVVAGVVLAGKDGSPAGTTDAGAATTTSIADSPGPTATTTSAAAPAVALEQVGEFQPMDLDPTDLQPPGLVNGFGIDGSILALANGIDGVTRVSIGNPTEPRPMDTFAVADAQAVTIFDGYLAALSGTSPGGQHVVVFPADGSGGVQLPFEGEATESLYHITAADGFIYLSGHDYVGIVDATDPTTPELVFEWNPPGSTGNPADVFVADGVGYFAAGWDGLYLFDLTDPAAPTMLGHWPSPDWIIDVVVADGVAYAALGDTGLALVDVSHPGSPVMFGSVAIPGFAALVDVTLGHALVGWLGTGGALGGVAVVDVGDPANPVFVDTFGRLQTITGLQAVGSHLLVAEETQGLLVYEITGIG